MLYPFVLIGSTVLSLLVTLVLLEKEKLITGLMFFCLSIILLVCTLISGLGYIEDEKLEKREVVLDVLSEEFETTDVYIVEKVATGEGYERFEIAVDGGLLEVIIIDDGSGEKRVVVDD